MTHEQLVSWLDGFMADHDKAGTTPTRRQHNRIRNKINLEFNYEPMPFAEFAHRYFTPYQDYWITVAVDAGVMEAEQVNLVFCELLMHRNQNTLWHIAGAVEMASILESERTATDVPDGTPTDRRSIEGTADTEQQPSR